MKELIRFGVSIDSKLLAKFDTLISERNYENRSEALRDLIRDTLIQHKIETETDIAALGSLTLVYDHHAKNLPKELGETQHNFHDVILSVMHMHVSHEDCMEIIALKGAITEITKLADTVLSLKGIKHGKLFLTLPSSEIAS